MATVTPEKISSRISTMRVNCDVCGKNELVEYMHAPRGHKHVCHECYRKMGWEV